MDSRIGLDYIVENREYVSKLGAALDTNNTIVKKQVFELLSALCAYNSEGYTRAIETLEFYKNLKRCRYRFKIVVIELERTTVVEYQVALLAFVNCVIISAADLQERLRIRNEFIGLKILPVLNNLRRIYHNVGDIIVQLDVFDEQRECDEAQSLQGPNGINLNSHLDVFYAILRQVADTPQEIPFLSILQHLLRIDPKESVSDIIWDTTEKLVHRATLLENHDDATRLLRTPSIQKFIHCPHCRGIQSCGSNNSTTNTNNTTNGNDTVTTSHSSRKGSILLTTTTITPNNNNTHNNQHNSSSIPNNYSVSYNTLSTGDNHNKSQSYNQCVTVPPPPPPPPTPPGQQIGTGAPPPPPLPAQFKNDGYYMSRDGLPPPPAPPPNFLSLHSSAPHHFNRPKTPDMMNSNDQHILLPQQETPAPKAKMRTINWNKIPPNKVIGKRNIWTVVADQHQGRSKTDIDWNEMEGLFCLANNIQGSPKLGRDCTDTLDRKTKKENSEITLLDGKRSLNVNIFLKQFRSSNEDIIELIKNGAHDDIGAEKLRGLLKILPEVDELDMLRNFSGDKNRLGNAEKFLMQLLRVPNYKLRIESMLLKEEFASNITYLEPCITAILFAGDDLMNNKLLQEVLYMIVVAGNFLNSGGYAGNAAGVKLSSLQKLTDIRANKPGMNLIHFVALQCEKKNPKLLEFPGQMTALDNASKTTSEQINNEINALDSRICKIKKQVELPTTERDIKDQMMEFLQAAEREVALLQRGMKDVDLMRMKLADFFCEDPSTFKIEECIKIFQTFCEKFKQAIKENEKRRVQEEQANIRRKQREELIARKTRQVSQCGTPVSDSENFLLVDPSFDPRCSPAMSRRRIGSFNSNGDSNIIRDDGLSPDITPNGSLRRRRSRALPEEDDSNLMEFLRSSGHDNSNRERKTSSYGSLDRSWARRARSGTPNKKRPELLNIDFGNDRERTNSPSPMPEHKEMQPDAGEAKPRISKEWRQKIESWLQANENDEKQMDDYKRRRRLTNNRRSLENDSESERSKLDPLPEEKATVNSDKEGQKRLSQGWDPSSTIDKSDVTGTIIAIHDDRENRNQKTQSKSETSYTRKINENNNESSLNVNDKLQRQQQQRSSPSLHVIGEEDSRRNVIQQLGEHGPTDRLRIYIRRPSESNLNDKTPNSTGKNSISSTPTSNSPQTNQHPKSPLIPIRSPTTANSITNKNSDNRNESNIIKVNTVNSNKESHPEKQNRIEIDSDNIETPPVVRRSINTSSISRFTNDYRKNEAANNQNNTDFDKQLENDQLGHFDRFSSARRTRRYKRPTDYSSGNEETSSNQIDSKNKTTDKANCNNSDTYTDIMNNNDINKNLDKIDSIVAPVDCKEKRLKRWHDRLKDLESVKTDNSNLPATQDKSSNGRHMSTINQDDVKEAIRSLKSPTHTPEKMCISQEVNEVTPVIPTSVSITNPSVKISNHELNDEGFEETQSLVSDTQSQGKESTSSYNETTDINELVQKEPKIIRIAPTPTTVTSNPGSKLQRVGSHKSSIQSALNKKKLFDRTRSLRGTTSTSTHLTSIPPHYNSSNNFNDSSTTGVLSSSQLGLSRRANPLRKSDSKLTSASGTNIYIGNNKRDVERSSSRNSLRSSRSSLNSAISTNTVKKMPLKSDITSSIDNSTSPSKRPLATQNSSSLYTRPSSYSSLSTTIGNNIVNSNRVPASRSSSSGSSIGPTIRRSLQKPNTVVSSGISISNLGNTNFKENQSSSVKPLVKNSSVANRLNIAAGNHNNLNIINTMNSNRSIKNNTTSSNSTTTNTSTRLSGFMRPTTASSTKRLQTDYKK